MNKKVLLVVLSLFAFSGSSMADLGGNLVVNIDCQYNDGEYDHTTYVGTAAAPDSGTYWNQLGTGTGYEIIDALSSEGLPTTIDITAENTVGAYHQDNNANDLLDDYWFDNTMVAKNITINGLLANTEYTLYMYGNETNVFGESEGCMFTFGGETKISLGAQTVPIPPNPWLEDYDHVIFDVISDASGQIVGTYGGDGNYNRWNGVQIWTNFPDRLVIAEGDPNVSESGPTSFTFTVALASQPTHNVTVTLNPDSQLTVDDPISGELLFIPGEWNVPQEVTVTAVDDDVIEGPHIGKVIFLLTSADPDYDNVATPTLLVNVADNEGGPLVQGSPVNVDEAQSAITDPNNYDEYTITLTREPVANVDIVVTTDGQTAVDTDLNTPTMENTLTFVPAEWDTPKAVYVIAVDDTVSEGPHTSTITNTCSSSDTGFDTNAKVALANVVDDEPYCGDGVSHDYYEADLNQDCYVNLGDFVMMAMYWLECTDPDPAVSGCNP